jgi:hypothetical protein
MPSYPSHLRNGNSEPFAAEPLSLTSKARCLLKASISLVLVCSQYHYDYTVSTDGSH